MINDLKARVKQRRSRVLAASVGVLVMFLLAACGLVVDASPPSISARVATVDGVTELVVTAVDAESGVQRIEVHDVRRDSLALRDSAVFPPKAVDEPVEPTRELRSPVAAGEDLQVLIVAVNGSGVEANQAFSSAVQPMVSLSDLPSALVRGEILNANVFISATGVETLHSVEVSVDGVAVPLVASAEGVYTFTWDTTGEQVGVHTLLVVAEFLGSRTVVLNEVITLGEADE